MLKQKTVLVTGAGGFIGSHLVEELVSRGASVRALLRYNGRAELGMLSAVPPHVRESLDIWFGNICDPHFTRSAIEGCDYVFHLAALIGIPYSYQAPQDYVTTNVLGTLNVLESCRLLGTSRLVHTSTSEVYGSAQYVPIDEAHPLQGQSPYSASKIGADKLVESYVNSFELRATIVRPFNTFGPRQSARAFIPTVIAQALCRDAVKLGSLDPVRDLTFVTDTAAGLIDVGLAPNTAGRTVNLGTGTGFTVGEVARTVLELVGKPNLPILCDPQRVRPLGSEVIKLISDNTLARTLTGWAPKHDIRSGLQATIDWMLLNTVRYDPDRYTV
jgi:NAD dependent epimerase/dehydratase